MPVRLPSMVLPRRARTRTTRPSVTAEAEDAPPREARPSEPDDLPVLPPPISVRPAPSPLRPLRYELRRAAGTGTGYLTAAAVLVTSALISLLLARIGHTPQPRLLAAWPQELPLPPAALGAGLLGARRLRRRVPPPRPGRGPRHRPPPPGAARRQTPRRRGHRAAAGLPHRGLRRSKLLYLVYGRELAGVPADWLSLSASWIGLIVGCAWAGVLAAGIFRSTTAGLAAVLAVPVLVVPLVHKALEGPSVRTRGRVLDTAARVRAGAVAVRGRALSGRRERG